MDSHASPNNLLEPCRLQQRVKDHWREIIHEQASFHEEYVLPHAEKRWQELHCERADIFKETKDLQDRIDWLKQLPEWMSSHRFKSAQQAERKRRSVELQEKSREYMKKLKKLHDVEEAFKTIHDTHNRIVESYTRQISTQVLERFPREIRDMCYDFILDENTLQAISNELRYRVDSTLNYARRSLPFPEKTSDLIKPSCTSVAFTTELLEMASRKQGPRETLFPKYPGDINRILDADPYDVGVRASAFYGDLELHWQFTNHVKVAKRHRYKRLRVFLFGNEALAEIRDVLLRIVDGHDRGITIRFHMNDFPPNGMEKVLPILNELTRRDFNFVRFFTRRRGKSWVPVCRFSWDKQAVMTSHAESTEQHTGTSRTTQTSLSVHAVRSS